MRHTLFSTAFKVIFLSLCILFLNALIPIPFGLWPSETQHSRSVFNAFYFSPSRGEDIWNNNQQFIAANQFPKRISHLISDARVDFFGDEPEILIINNSSYTPRPVPMRLLVSSADFKKMNGDFYRNIKTAPDFVLLSNLGPASLDSIAKTSLVLNYELVDFFKDYFVLKKKTALWRDFSYDHISDGKVKTNEWVQISNNEKGLLWIKIKIEETFVSKLKKFFLKPTLIKIEYLTESGFIKSEITSTKALASGVLLNPIFQKQSVYPKEFEYDRIIAWRLKVLSNERDYFSEDAKFKVFRVLNQVSGHQVNLDELETLFPVFNFAENDLATTMNPSILSAMNSGQCSLVACLKWKSQGIREYKFFTRDKPGTNYLIKGFVKNLAPDITQEIDVIINGETVAQISLDDRGQGNGIPIDIMPIDILFEKASGLNSIVLQSNYLDEKENSNTDLDLKKYPPIFVDLGIYPFEPKSLFPVENDTDALLVNNKEKCKNQSCPEIDETNTKRFQFFNNLCAKTSKLKGVFKNAIPISGQQVQIKLNGNMVANFDSTDLLPHLEIPIDIDITGSTEDNHITFEYGDWNGKEKTYAEHDPRKLAVVFMSLDLNSSFDGDVKSSLNLLKESSPAMNLKGLSALGCNDKECWRWAEGPKTDLLVRSCKSRKYWLHGELINVQLNEDSVIELIVNGEIMKTFSANDISAESAIAVDLHFNSSKGTNLITFRHSHANQLSTLFDENKPLFSVAPETMKLKQAPF